MKVSVLPMVSEEELRKEYADAGDRIWHLVPEGGDEPALCGAKAEGSWVSIGLIPTCRECIEIQKEMDEVT